MGSPEKVQHKMKEFLAALCFCCLAIGLIAEEARGSDGISGGGLLNSKTLGQRVDDARDYWTEGDMSYAEGKPNEALPFHRAALRMWPESLEYQLKVAEGEFRLGVGENRMDLIHKAYKRIQIVLSKDPTNSVAKNYFHKISEDYSLCVDESCMYWSGLTNVHEFPQLSPVEELTSCGRNCFDFPDFSHRSEQPFVMRNVL